MNDTGLPLEKELETARRQLADMQRMFQLAVHDRDKARGEVAELKTKLAAAAWDLAHYRDSYMLSVGMTADQLAARSAVLDLADE